MGSRRWVYLVCFFITGRLCVAFGHSKRRGGTATLGLGLGAGQVDGAEALLVLHNVVLESKEQALGVLGSEDDAALDVGLGHAGQDADKIQHYLGTAVRDDGQVGISSLCHLGREFNFQLVVVVLIFHF